MSGLKDAPRPLIRNEFQQILKRLIRDNFRMNGVLKIRFCH